MKNMLYKEIKLALHPTSIIFLSLSAMLKYKIHIKKERLEVNNYGKNDKERLF